MNRKLHNSMLGLGATGLMLVFALIAASPVLPGQDVSTPVALAADTTAATDHADVQADAQANAEAIEAHARNIEAHARRLESELDRSTSLGETIASAVSFAAVVSTEAALSAAFEATSDEAERQRAATREKRRHARQVRGALAVPYFSFAQGLRRGSRS
ncbi:hypothetical protein [Luteimonas mephitis]|uniref:hypothetical protein n=1 Tax=Luteimonas mephitis TaxID=83615 RepID=UPI0004064B6F|nr:hypothetical protein [Luteimonas mephitis]